MYYPVNDTAIHKNVPNPMLKITDLQISSHVTADTYDVTVVVKCSI